MPTSHSIALWSVSHTKYSLLQREFFSLTSTQCNELEQALLLNDQITGVLVLSTCNRTEILISYTEQSVALNPQLNSIVASTGDTIGDTIATALLDYLQLDISHLDKGYSLYHNEQAFKWLVKVSAGLKSQILGEAEVFGQFKQAFTNAASNQHLDSTLNLVCEKITRATKDIRAQSKLGHYSVSLASIAAKTTQIIFDTDKLLNLLLIGSGENNLLLLRELLLQTKRVIIVSRSQQRTMTSINNFFQDGKLLSKVLQKVEIIEYPALEQAVSHADVIVASTASKTPLLTYAIIDKVRVKQQFKPLFILDLSVPRNIESSVADLDGVFLYNLEHISDIQNDNQNMRFQAAIKAEKLIAVWVESFRREKLLRDSSHLITSLRQQISVAQEQIVNDLIIHLETFIEHEIMQKISKQLKQSNAKLLHQCTEIITQTISNQHNGTTTLSDAPVSFGNSPEFLNND